MTATVIVPACTGIDGESTTNTSPWSVNRSTELIFSKSRGMGFCEGRRKVDAVVRRLEELRNGSALSDRAL